MRKSLLIGGGVLVTLIASVVVVVGMQPADVRVERSRVVAATPADVWPHVADLRAFPAWSPWVDRDPSQLSTFSDPSSGVGAWYAWKGNEDVGSGKMTITAVEPERKLVEDLAFIEPFASTAVVTLALQPVEGGTMVTWGFDTENDFFGKAFSLFLDMDAMIGPDFETGLERLAGLAEADREARELREAPAEAPPEGTAAP